MTTMQMFTRLAAGVALLTGAGALSHFFYIAISKPEKMKFCEADNRSPFRPPNKTIWDRACLWSVVISMAILSFSGVYGLTSWLLHENAAYPAFLAAIASITLLQHIERYAYTRLALKREQIVNRELTRFIENANSPSESTVKRFQEKAKATEDTTEHFAYLELANIAKILAERDRDLCKYAIAKAFRDAEEAAPAQKK
jgi:hypothetical protein